jgi:ATP-dependent RNA circularization protein (DNA/RNA ligase family)
MIPNGYRICGENLYAKHSIYYDSLDSYFEAFNVWDGDVCLDWDSTVEFVNGLGIITVPILYDGIFDERIISDIIHSLDTSIQEGVVIRNADSFKHNEFSQNVFKWVRKNHVQTDQHWMMQKIVPNSLKKI